MMTSLKKFLFIVAFTCLVPVLTSASVFNQQNAQNLNGGIIDGDLKLGAVLDAEALDNDATVKGVTSIESLLSYVKSYFNDKLFIGYPADLSPVDYDAALQVRGSAKLVSLADSDATGSRLLCVNNDGVIESCVDGVDSFICGDTFYDDRNGAIYQTIDINGKCWFKSNLVFSHITQTDLISEFPINNEYNSATFSSSNMSAPAFSRLRAFCASQDAIFDTPGLNVEIERDYETYGMSVLRLRCGAVEPDYFILEQNHNLYPLVSSYVGSTCPAGWSYPSSQEFMEISQLNLVSEAGFSAFGGHYASGLTLGTGAYYLTNDPDDLIRVTSHFLPGTGFNTDLASAYSYDTSADNVSAAAVRCRKNA